MGPTDIVNDKSSLFLNSKNSSISFMSTTIDSNEVTLASSQTKETTCINSSSLLSSPSSLSNSIDSIYSPDLLSALSLNTSPPFPSPKSINNLTLSTTFSTISNNINTTPINTNATSSTLYSKQPLLNNSNNKSIFTSTQNSFNLNLNITDFNVYYPPPLNISDDDESINNNNNSISAFISNKRKSPYLLRGEKKPSRCSECNRVILKYIVSINSKKHHNNIFQKSNGFKCSQCQNAICEKCFLNYKNNINNNNNNNKNDNNNNIELKPISTSSINLISSCISCINNNHNNNNI